MNVTKPRNMNIKAIVTTNLDGYSEKCIAVNLAIPSLLGKLSISGNF